jgi:hypothetical protein
MKVVLHKCEVGSTVCYIFIYWYQFIVRYATEVTDDVTQDFWSTHLHRDQSRGKQELYRKTKRVLKVSKLRKYFNVTYIIYFKIELLFNDIISDLKVT